MSEKERERIQKTERVPNGNYCNPMGSIIPRACYHHNSCKWQKAGKWASKSTDYLSQQQVFHWNCTNLFGLDIEIYAHTHTKKTNMKFESQPSSQKFQSQVIGSAWGKNNDYLETDFNYNVHLTSCGFLSTWGSPFGSIINHSPPSSRVKGGSILPCYFLKTKYFSLLTKRNE